MREWRCLEQSPTQPRRRGSWCKRVGGGEGGGSQGLSQGAMVPRNPATPRRWRAVPPEPRAGAGRRVAAVKWLVPVLGSRWAGVWQVASTAFSTGTSSGLNISSGWGCPYP